MAEKFAAPGAPSLQPLQAACVELNDLKRITSAGRDGSIATRLFRQAWAALARGEAPETVALRTTAGALVAARLGDLDARALGEAGLSQADVRAVFGRALDALGAPLDARLRERLRGALDTSDAPQAGWPAFVDALAAQPRAGITTPGRPRIVLEPPENHAEHCLVVGVYGVLFAPRFGADPTPVFLAALSHHLHNALLADSGFAGETLLGEHLAPAMAAATARCLQALAPRLREQVQAARAILADDATAEARAFHAADVVDRVLQVGQYLRANTLTLARALGECELVHDGPVRAFHERVLAEIGLA